MKNIFLFRDQLVIVIPHFTIFDQIRSHNQHQKNIPIAIEIIKIKTSSIKNIANATIAADLSLFLENQTFWISIEGRDRLMLH